MLCGGCADQRHALPRLRSVTPNLRASSGDFKPECVCVLQSYPGAAHHILALVTRCHFPPPWTEEDLVLLLRGRKDVPISLRSPYLSAAFLRRTRGAGGGSEPMNRIGAAFSGCSSRRSKSYAHAGKEAPRGQPAATEVRPIFGAAKIHYSSWLAHHGRLGPS